MPTFFAANLRRLPHLVLTVSVTMLVLALSSTSWAQTQDTEASGNPPSTEQAEALIATLEDEAQRQALIETLKTLVAADQQAEDDVGEADGDLVSNIAGQISQLDNNVVELLEQLDDGTEFLDWLYSQTSDGDLRSLWLEALWQVSLVVAAGMLGWLLVAWLERRQLRRLEQREDVTWLELPVITLGRICLRVATIIAFAIAAYACLTVINPNELTRVVSIALVNALVLVRAGTVTVRILLSPLAPALRIIPVKDHEAVYLAVWTRRFLALGIYGFFAIELLASLGLPDSSTALLQRLVGFCLTLLGFMVILQSRETVARWIREHPETGGARMLRQRLADIWHVFAMLALAALFAAWALNVDEGFETLLRGFGTTAIVLFGALIASTMVRRALLKLFVISDEYSDRFPGLERRSNRYLTILVVALNVVIWGFATALIMDSWGLGAVETLMSPGGLSVVGRLASIALMVVIAIIIWELGDGLISAYLNQNEEAAVSPRLKTLLPLMRNVLLIVISTIAVITILSELGVETAPLLAGAGVVGLAVGFGAQTLVKDVITGAFIMFEDQFSVGDWIEAGGKLGGVESITIRTVQLRDFDGYVHTVPFGEITALTNMMRDFGYAMIDVGVAYQENTDRVIEVIREVDAEARRDEAFAGGLVGDLEVMGVNELGDSAVTVRVRIKTLAGYQWGVRREYLRQIKLKFDEVGIEIPFPHMTVYFGEIRGGDTSPAHVRIDAEDTMIDAEVVEEEVSASVVEKRPDAGPDAGGISHD